MSKRKNKKFPKQPKEYKVGYCKPPEAYKWQKGCKSPNPSGRPKKVKNLQEALQLSLNKEVNTKDANGLVKKVTCFEALATKPLLTQFQKTGQPGECFIAQISYKCLGKSKNMSKNKFKKKNTCKNRQKITHKSRQLKKNTENFSDNGQKWILKFVKFLQSK